MSNATVIAEGYSSNVMNIIIMAKTDVIPVYSKIQLLWWYIINFIYGTFCREETTRKTLHIKGTHIVAKMV